MFIHVYCCPKLHFSTILSSSSLSSKQPHSKCFSLQHSVFVFECYVASSLKIIFSSLIFLCVIIAINLGLVYCVLPFFPKLPLVSQFLHTITITSMESHTWLVLSQHILKICAVINSGYWARLWITHNKFNDFAPLLASLLLLISRKLSSRFVVLELSSVCNFTSKPINRIFTRYLMNWQDARCSS